MGNDDQKMEVKKTISSVSAIKTNMSKAPVLMQKRFAPQMQDESLYSPSELLELQQTQTQKKSISVLQRGVKPRAYVGMPNGNAVPVRKAKRARPQGPELKMEKKQARPQGPGQKMEKKQVGPRGPEQEMKQKESAEERKTVLSADQLQTITDNIEKQKEVMIQEVMEAEKNLRKIYKYLRILRSRDPLFLEIKQQLGKLLTLQTFWNQRVSDPKTCELLQIETTEEKYQQIANQIWEAVDSYSLKHAESKGQGFFMKKRMALMNYIKMPLDTLIRMSGSYVNMQKELNYARKDAEGYEKAQSDDGLGRVFAEIEKEEEKSREDKEKEKKNIKNAVYSYTKNDPYMEKQDGTLYAEYQCLNGLKRGQLSEKDFHDKEKWNSILEKARGLDQATELSRRQEDALLYRGTDLGKVLGKKLDSPELLIGKVITDPGYLSTSRDEDTAESFCIMSASNKLMDIIARQGGRIRELSDPLYTGDCKFKILSRKGSHGLDISSVSDIDSEEEVMFAAGTRMLIRNHAMETYDLELTKEAIDYYNKKKGREAIKPDMEGFKFSVDIPVFEAEIR